MPGEKVGRRKDDTWSEVELKKSLGAKKETAEKPKSKSSRDAAEEPSRRKDDDRRKERSDEKKSTMKEPDERRHKDGEKDRDRDREKDRDKGRDRDRDREKERDRDRDREKDRDRDRDREKERDRDREKERDRDRDRHDEKSKTRDRDRDEQGERKHRSERSDEKKRSRDDKEEKPRDDDRKSKSRKDEKEESDSRRTRSDRDERDSRGERKHRSRDEDDAAKSKDEKRPREKKESREDDSRSTKPRTKDADDGDESRRREKERRSKHREAEEESDHYSTSKSSKSTSKKQPAESDNSSQSSKASKSKPKKQEDDYEDDFEDYADDFDDDEDDSASRRSDQSRDSRDKGKSKGTPMDDLRDAMREENERLGSGASENDRKTSTKAKQGTKGAAKTSSSFINFVAAKQREMTTTVASATRKRAKDLFDMVDLDFVRFDIFEMPPLQEYSQYMLIYGSANRQQASVQTNEELFERDIQTEDIDYDDKWTQHPPVNFKAAGGVKESSTDSQQAIDNQQLNSFLQRVTPVVWTLLLESTREQESREQDKSSDSSWSEQMHPIELPDLVKDYRFVGVHLGRFKSSLLTVHQNKQLDGAQACLCVWRSSDSPTPDQLLGVDATPTCYSFSPVKESIVLAGTSDGNILLWDLREASFIHQSNSYHTRNGQPMRAPTYNTAVVSESHNSPVVRVCPVASQGQGAEESANLYFQVVSVDENALVIFWTAIEDPRAEEWGSPGDFGLFPGGKVKLMRSASLDLRRLSRDERLSATELDLRPDDTNHIFVGTDKGTVLHVTRQKGRASPFCYRDDSEDLSRITSIHFHPTDSQCFLVGSSSGKIRLHSVHYESPLTTWQTSTLLQSVQYVRWIEPSFDSFITFDDQSSFSIWKLSQNRNEPVLRDDLKKSKIQFISTSYDGRFFQVVLCTRRGEVKVCRLRREFLEQPATNKTLQTLLSESTK